MVTITINGERKQYPRGTRYEEIAKEYQPSYKDMIALVIENGKIRELIKPANKNCELSFLTIRNDIGHKTYVRTAIMTMVKAVYDVLGRGITAWSKWTRSLPTGMSSRLAGG